MILIDTNLLVYGGVAEARFHERANPWLREQFSAAPRVGLPWHSLLGFVRLASDRRTFPNGPSVEEAWRLARIWMNAPNAWIPEPTERHDDVLDDLISSVAIRSKDVMDLHLAALAIEHGLTLCSADTGFVRFKKLRWMNPLD